MWKRTLFTLALGVASAAPVLAQTPRWEATATPVTQDDGPPYCRVTHAAGHDDIMFRAFPDRQEIWVYTPSLEGLDFEIEATLRIGNAPAYPLTWLGGGGSYRATLTSVGMATVLDALILYGDEGTRLTVGSETALALPPDGAQDAARTVWDCRTELLED
jgi:hypothetical protein